MDVSQSKKQHHHHVVRWPTDWMHRHRMQLHIDNAFPPPLAAPAVPLPEPKKALSSSSSSSTSGVGAAAPTFSSSAMKSSINRSLSASKVSSGQSVTYAGRRHCSPCRKLQQYSPQPRRCCQPGPTPSPDLLLAEKAEWKRTLHDTTYRTYKALPRSNRPFGLRDFALLREIFALAENLTQADGTEVRLMDVLRAYDMVLQKHGMDPAEDTFYYRMLLKLSLRSEKDWWKRLNQEIVKNDILMKVTSFRNHKLLLCYWLQWRCHHEKGVLQENSSRKDHFLEGENDQDRNGMASQDDKQHADTFTLPTSQQQKSKGGGQNTMKSVSLVPFCSGVLPIKDTLLVMDVVELPAVEDLKCFNRFDLKGVAASFQAWQRVVRQRKKKRCTREKSARQWRRAVCFNDKNTLARALGFWQQLSSTRMTQANLWHHNLLQQKCFDLWSNHCRLLKESCKAGEDFHEKRLCLSILSEWKGYTSSLKALCKDLCKGRVFCAWKRVASFHKHAAQVMDCRLLSASRKLLSFWRSRLVSVNQHKSVLSQCRKIHHIHVLSSCFQGWHGVCYQSVKRRRQVAICQGRRSQRAQMAVMQKWRAWIQYKRSLQQVLSFGISRRSRFLQKETFTTWLKWWGKRNSVKRKYLEFSLCQKRRVLFDALHAWEKSTSTRKYVQDCMVKALKFYASQLCRKSIHVWTLWQANHTRKLKRSITIMGLVSGNQCKRVLLQWKYLSDFQKKERKKIRSIESYCKNQKKVKYWHLWCQQSGYQAAITRCCARRNQKVAVLILKALRALAKESPKRRKVPWEIFPHEQEEQCLRQKFKANDTLPHLQAEVDVNSIRQNRRNYMHNVLHSMKELIRKWKHFVEIRRTRGMNKDLVVKFWTKFWLKTAIEGWKIVLQKGKLKRKLLLLPKQIWNEETKTWTLKKLEFLQERALDGNKDNVALYWRSIMLEKLALLAWTQVHAVQQDQTKQEMLNIRQLKRWWILTMLSQWKMVAHKYTQEKEKLYQNRCLMYKKEDEDILQNKGTVAHSNRSCLQTIWNLLLVNAKLDQDSKRALLRFRQTHLKLFLILLMKYTHQKKVAKALQTIRKSSLLQYLLQQWKQSTFEALQEKPIISMIKRHLSKLPKKHKIMNAVLEGCPRWTSCKGFQIWREWSNLRAAKRTHNRKAWEHLAKVLHKKAFASFQTALTGARTLRTSIKHFEICYQVKVLLAWKTFSMEHTDKKALKLSAFFHYKNRTGSTVLKKWRLYSHISQREDFAKKKAEVFWRVLSLRKCLIAWTDMFLRYKAKLQYFTWIKIRMDFYCLHNVLCAWRYSSQHKITQRNHIDYMRERQRIACLYQKFHIWIWYIHRKKCLRAAQEVHRRRHLKSFFHSWVCGIVQLKFRREAEEKVRNHIFNKFCRTAFLVWQDVTVMAGHARSNQALAVNKIRHCRVSCAFLKWKAVVRSMKFINKLIHKSILRHKQKLFHKWIEIIKQQEKWSESHISVICMRQKRCILIVFQVWLQRTFKQKKERQENHRALIFERRCTILRVFKLFKGWMHDRQMKEGFSLLACGKLQHVYMKRAFNAWLKKVGVYSRRRLIYHRLQQAWDGHLMAKAFGGIHGVVAENYHLRRTAIKAFKVNLEAIKVDKLVCLQRQHSCHSLLQYWRERTIFCIALHHKEQSFKVNFLRRAFQEWRAYTKNKIELKALGKKVSMCHCTFLTRQCWLRWQFRTEEAQYQQQFLLFKTFRAWIKYAKWKAFWRCMEQDATLMILQSLQKRVLWAWQSLVREIAIRREEHQQQRFLQREAMVLAVRTERRHKLESLSSVFKAWQARLYQALSISSFINKRKHHTKGCVWSVWLSLAGQSQQGKRLRHQWIRSVLRSTLNAWREACRMHIDESRNREAEATRFATWKCKRVGWIQWTSYVGSCKEKVKALQDCLALIQTGQCCDSVREMIRAWKDYTTERGKRREHSWAAEASYKRHKLADYLTAWHHYTAASKDSASSLRGTIQVYKQRGSNHLQSMAGSRYRFRQGFGHISAYGNDEMMGFHKVTPPAVVIEEVNSPPVEEFEGLLCLSHSSSHWTEVLLENEDAHAHPPAGNLTRNVVLRAPARLLENGPLWSPARSIKYLGLEVEDDVDDWSVNDVDVGLTR